MDLSEKGVFKMTLEEALRFIDPETDMDALAEVEYYNGFKGKEAAAKTLREASQMVVDFVRRVSWHDAKTPPHGCRGRQHDSWGTCIDLVHAIEHQQWLDSPVEKRESPGTTNRSFKPIPLGHEPFPKIERVEE